MPASITASIERQLCWVYVAVTQGEKSLAAVIEESPVSDLFTAGLQMVAEPVLHESKPDNQSSSPETEKHNQG